MKKRFVKQALVLSFTFLCLYAFSQDAVELKYKFVKGKTFVISSQISTDVTQLMGGQEMKVKNEFSSTSEMNIENVEPNGNATVLITFLNAQAHSLMMGVDTTMTFNDLNEQERIVLTPSGRQISQEKIGEMEKLAMLGSIDQLLKLQVLPNAMIKTGDKWQDQIIDSTKATAQSPIDRNTTSDMEYEFIGKENKDGIEYYKISYSGTLMIEGKGNQMGMEIFLEGSGQTEGFSYFDPMSSMVVYTEGNTEMNLTVAVSGQQNMNIPMVQSVKLITKIEEKH